MRMEKWRGMRETGNRENEFCASTRFLKYFYGRLNGSSRNLTSIDINASMRPIRDAVRRQKAAQLHHAPAT